MSGANAIGLIEGSKRVAVGGRARRLNEIDLTDIYISEAGEVIIRGSLDAPNEPISRIDPSLVSDLDEVRRKVTSYVERPGSESWFLDYDNMRYRVTKIPSIGGVWYTLRRSLSVVPEFYDFPFPKRAIQELGRIGKSGRGLILVCGQTGDGKTTTCYSLLQRFLTSFGGTSMTIENPPEMSLNGRVGDHGQCFQVSVEDGDFTSALKRSMRVTPKFILVGEILGGNEAREVLRASINGHVVLSTIHAGSVQEAIQSLLKLSVDQTTSLSFAQHMLSQGIAAVIHQKLTTAVEDGVAIRRPEATFLFMGGEAGPARLKVRDGKLEQLANEVEQQAALMKQDRSPIQDGK